MTLREECDNGLLKGCMKCIVEEGWECINGSVNSPSVCTEISM